MITGPALLRAGRLQRRAYRARFVPLPANRRADLWAWLMAPVLRERAAQAARSAPDLEVPCAT